MSAPAESTPKQAPPVGAEVPDRATLLATLVTRMARGQQEALAQLYDETSSVLNGLLLRMLCPADTEEILLDVYMRAWKKAASFIPDRGSVQAWLVIMARTMAIDRLRQKRAHPENCAFQLAEAAELISADASPELYTEHTQRSNKIAAILRELPTEQREVLELAFFSGFTHTELSERLGQPLGTIKSRIRMALGHVRATLKEGMAA